MARRRQFGYVFRKRRPPSKSKDKEGNDAYYPGWYIRIRQGEGEIQRYAGGDKATASEFLRRLQTEAEQMQLLGKAPENHRTFGQFAVEYLAWSQRVHTKDTHDRARSLIQGALVARFGESLLQAITQPAVERFLMSGATWKAGTRNRCLSMISSIFKRAMELGHVRANPAVGVRRGKEDRTPLPLVPADDQQKVLDALPPHLLPLALLALDTGARQGELLRLRWADIDLAAKLVLVRKAKSHRPRGLRMPQRLHAVLAARAKERGAGAGPSDLLFPDLIGTDGRLKSWPHRQYKAAVENAGFPGLRFHDLRHLTAINLIRGGLDLPAIQATLGHTSLQSTYRYAEYSDGSAAERAADVLDRMQAKLASKSKASQA